MRAFYFTKCWISLCVLACGLAFLWGCQTPGATNPGPIYKLRTSPIPEPTTPVAVSISDRRPGSEITFQAGSVNLADYENAIDVLTLDNFDPEPIKLLGKSLAGHLSQLALPPTWAEVDLTRFRVTVNRSEIMEAEYERQKRMSDSERMMEERRATREYNKAMKDYNKSVKSSKSAGQSPLEPPPPPGPYLPPSAAPGVGIGVGLAAAESGGVGIVGGIAAGMIAAAIVSDIEDQPPAIRQVSGGDTASGVTCQITMHVRLHWSDGRRQEFDIHSEAHTPPASCIEVVDQQNPLMALQLSVIPTVQQAMQQASEKLAVEAAEFLARP